jgi:hypothetical protein
VKRVSFAPDADVWAEIEMETETETESETDSKAKLCVVE